MEGESKRSRERESGREEMEHMVVAFEGQKLAELKRMVAAHKGLDAENVVMYQEGDLL